MSDINDILRKKFQRDRVKAFDELVQDLETIKRLLKNAKLKTREHYSRNPRYWTTLYPTDSIREQLNEIIEELQR